MANYLIKTYQSVFCLPQKNGPELAQFNPSILRGVQSLVLFSSGYGTGENRQLGFGEISIFFLSHIIINNRVGCGGGLSSLYFMFVSGFLLPWPQEDQGLNRPGLGGRNLRDQGTYNILPLLGLLLADIPWEQRDVTNYLKDSTRTVHMT